MAFIVSNQVGGKKPFSQFRVSVSYLVLAFYQVFAGCFPGIFYEPIGKFCIWLDVVENVL